MSLFDGMMGNASPMDLAEARHSYAPLLAAGERIERAYRLVRDVFLFSDKRLIVVNQRGVTGAKTEYHSVPYRSITHFSVETAGHLDMDAELRIWVAGREKPIELTFSKEIDIHEVQSVLAAYVLRGA